MDSMRLLLWVALGLLVLLLFFVVMKRPNEGMYFSGETQHMGYRQRLEGVVNNPYSGIEMENEVAQ